MDPRGVLTKLLGQGPADAPPPPPPPMEAAAGVVSARACRSEAELPSEVTGTRAATEVGAVNDE
jgi:hypothetical protein